MPDQSVKLIGRIPWLMANVDRKKPWLVGVSGGADSVALLHLLVAAGFHEVVVCHLDHGLRGRTSTEDAKFVKRLATALGLKFESERADVKLRMAAKSESLETAARNLRHLFFSRSMAATKYYLLIMRRIRRRPFCGICCGVRMVLKECTACKH